MCRVQERVIHVKEFNQNSATQMIIACVLVCLLLYFRDCSIGAKRNVNLAPSLSCMLRIVDIECKWCNDCGQLWNISNKFFRPPSGPNESLVSCPAVRCKIYQKHVSLLILVCQPTGDKSL
jgi:hypothetical protein